MFRMRGGVVARIVRAVEVVEHIYFALQDESLRYELLGLLKNFVQFK